MSKPRLTFAGTFRADVSTINNDFRHFDTEHFVPNDALPSSDNWNPTGSGQWNIDAFVTNVCYFDGHCVSDSNIDPVVGIKFGGNAVWNCLFS